MSPPTLSLWLRNIAPIQELEKEEEIKERKGRRVIAFLERGSSARSLTLHSNEKKKPQLLSNSRLLSLAA